MTTITELEALAKASKGWENCNQAWTVSDPDYEGIAFVGHVDEDGNKYDLAEINTGQYYADKSAIVIASFYAKANPATILALIALVRRQHESMLAVLCDPEGTPCFDGSNGDREVIAEALAAFENFGKE